MTHLKYLLTSFVLVSAVGASRLVVAQPAPQPFDVAQTIVKIEQVDSSELGYIGTAFSVGRGVFLTAEHICQRQEGMTKFRVIKNGKKYPVIGVVHSPVPGALDACLVFTEGAVPGVVPIKAGDANTNCLEALSTAGFPNDKFDKHEVRILSFALEADAYMMEAVAQSIPLTDHGASGSPVVTAKGQLCGIVISIDPEKKLTQLVPGN
jgi:hypothetical protein